jgi:hypothetical protein
MTCQVIDRPLPRRESAATFNPGAAMTVLASPRFLRTVLWADALSAAASAFLQLAGAALLAPLLGLSPTLLLASGALLVPFALAATWMATRDVLPRGAIQALAIANLAWAAGCLALLFTGAAGTTLGQVYLVMQAVAVALLAELQWFGVRRVPEPGWA